MSIFNPYVLLSILIAVLGSFTSGYYKGSNDELDHQQLEIAALNAEARQKEQLLVAAIQTQTNKLQKANQDARLAQQKRNSDIDSGALRLRVKTPECSIPTSTDASATPRDSVQATSELDRETAKSLIAITDQGDANTRQLNACIDAYNTAFQSINQRSKP